MSSLDKKDIFIRLKTEIKMFCIGKLVNYKYNQ